VSITGQTRVSQLLTHWQALARQLVQARRIALARGDCTPVVHWYSQTCAVIGTGMALSAASPWVIATGTGGGKRAACTGRPLSLGWGFLSMGTGMGASLLRLPSLAGPSLPVRLPVPT
jgi:hypothetical protein